MTRLGEILARFRAGRNRVALEKAEQERLESPAERRVSEEDYEAQKEDVQIKEYLPGLHDDP
jgi:hypothetical protein